MASKKITAMPDWAGNQVSTDLVTGVDLSEPVATQNVKSTLNDLFSIITKNITDGAVRFQEFSAPSLSASGQGSLYFDSTSKTFKGSRNASAYDNLMFGSGANQQVAVFTTLVDKVAGYAPFYYNSSTERLYITDTIFAPTIEVSKTGTTPAYFKGLGGQGFASIGNWSNTVAAPAYLNFYRGASGPALPTSGMGVGSIRFRPAQDTGDVPTTVGGARIDVVTTEAATVGVGGGVGMTIYTAANGEVNDNARWLINQAGVVVAGVNSATITSSFGTNTRTVHGELSVYDSDAVHQFGNPFSGNNNKIIVIQGRSGQTKALTEWQNNSGTLLFSVGAAGSLSFGGATGIAVSAAGQGRIYFDSGTNTFKASQNGGAYANLVNPLSPGGTTGSIQYNTGAGLIDGDNYFLWDTASATIQIGSAGILTGKILLRNSTNTNTLTIIPGATGGNITFTLPTTTGSSGQFLQTNGSGVLSWAVASGGLTVGTTAIASGIAGRILYETSGNVLGEIPGSSVTANGAISFTPTARTSGSPALPFAQFLSAADTGLSNVEQIAFQIGGDASQASVTRTWTGGGAAIANQRHILIVPPTLAASSAQTFTVASTLEIAGGPIQGALATIGTSVIFRATGSSTRQFMASASGTGFYWNGTSPGQAFLFQRNGTTGYITHYESGATGIAGTSFGANGFIVFGNDSDFILGSSTRNTYFLHPSSGYSGRIESTNGLWTIGGSSVALSQLHVFAQSASRVAFRVDSLNNSTVALNQFYLNADDTATIALHSVFSVDSNGTAANGLGGQLQFQLESTTTNQQNAAAINWYWVDATHATRSAAIQLQVVGNAAALATMAEFDVPTAAGDTAFKVFDVDNAALERVTVGAADSGGSGFKVLRIPN